MSSESEVVVRFCLKKEANFVSGRSVSRNSCFRVRIAEVVFFFCSS